MNLSLLVHTFNGYQHLWQGSARSFVTWWDEFDHYVPFYWGTDFYPDNAGSVEWYGRLIESGPGEWSDRLRRLLTQIDTDYVLYMQEDHWPKTSPPDLYELMAIVQNNDLFRLQISPIVHFYKLIPSGNIHFFNQDSKYLVSHQPSIWKKSFLLDCLKPSESPWVNEYEGTKRLKNDPMIEKKIAIYPCDWFTHKCIKGKVVDN